MSLLPSVATYITVEATRFRSAVSEFLIQTIGKDINYLLDKIDSIETAIEAFPFSELTPVVAVGPSLYSVPSGYQFVGTVSVRIATSNLGYNISADSGGGTFDAPTFVPANGGVEMSHAVSSATSVGSPDVAAWYATGFLYKTVNIVIP